jgi:hypothetical protein
VEGGCLDTLRYCPFHSALEDIWVVPIHTENEASVDHDAQAVKAADRFGVITVKVLEFPLLTQGLLIGAFKAHEQAA